MFGKSMIFKRIVSGLSALVMFAGNALSSMPAVFADTIPAHSINLFDINVKQGAEYSSADDLYVWHADTSNDGHKFVYNIKLSVSGVGTDTEEFIKIRFPAHILKYRGQTEAGIAVGGECPDTAELPVPSIDQIYY